MGTHLMTDRDDLYAIMDRIFDEFDMPPGRYEIADAILTAGWTPRAPNHPHVGPMTAGGHWWVDVQLPDDREVILCNREVILCNREVILCKYCGTVLTGGRIPETCPREWTRT
jgi:hypothetical protein